MSKKSKKKINITKIVKENYYFLVVLGVLLVCIIIIGISGNNLNKTEKKHMI